MMTAQQPYRVDVNLQQGNLKNAQFEPAGWIIAAKLKS
jgi:hypothetical protein